MQIKMIFIFFVLSFFSFLSAAEEEKETKTAIFAGGCFWCVEKDFDGLEGVISTTSGYIGGNVKNPTYKQVSQGNSGHVEAVEIVYDPKKISYQKLLDFYWKNIDPTTDQGQFCDEGRQYRPVIFYLNPEQKKLAEESVQAIKNQYDIHPILVNILPAKEFYPAEEYHQNFYKKNPIRYKVYRYLCGRDQRLKELWGKNE